MSPTKLPTFCLGAARLKSSCRPSRMHYGLPRLAGVSGLSGAWGGRNRPSAPSPSFVRRCATQLTKFASPPPTSCADGVAGSCAERTGSAFATRVQRMELLRTSSVTAESPTSPFSQHRDELSLTCRTPLVR
jgi:hypothetical protein